MLTGLAGLANLWQKRQFLAADHVWRGWGLGVFRPLFCQLMHQRSIVTKRCE